MNASDNIRLRAMEPEDLDLLYHVENDPDVWDVGITNVPYSRYLLHDYVSSTTGDIYADRQLRLIIELTGDAPTAIGIADIINFDPRHRRAELGIVIAKPFRHLGHAAATIAALVRYGRQVLHLHQLYVVIAVTNTPVVTLFLNAGFAETARLHHWLYDGTNYYDALVLQKLL